MNPFQFFKIHPNNNFKGNILFTMNLDWKTLTYSQKKSNFHNFEIESAMSHSLVSPLWPWPFRLAEVNPLAHKYPWQHKFLAFASAKVGPACAKLGQPWHWQKPRTCAVRGFPSCWSHHQANIQLYSISFEECKVTLLNDTKIQLMVV